MQTHHRNSYQAFSILAALAFLLSTAQLLPAHAGKLSQDDGLRRSLDPQTGLLTFLGADPANPPKIPGIMRAGMAAEERGQAILDIYGREFGILEPGRDLVLKNSEQIDAGRGSARYQQVYQGVPVMGGELIVNTTEEGALLSISGEVSQVADLSIEPALSADQAGEVALRLMERNYAAEASRLKLSEPELWIFDEHLLRPGGNRPPMLVWRMEASLEGEPVRELILVGAQDGNIPLHFNQVDASWTPGNSDFPETVISYDKPAESPALAPSSVQYSDLVVDPTRGRLYGSDKLGAKIDVISMSTLTVVKSYPTFNDRSPTALDLSPDGNELAIALPALYRVQFINLTDGTQILMPSDLTHTGKPNDVVYGRAGILYAISSTGVHVIDTATHTEDSSQYQSEGTSNGVLLSSGAISSDGNTLYSVTGHSGSSDKRLLKYDVSAGLPKPVLIKYSNLSETPYRTTTSVKLVNDEILLLSLGRVYDTKELTLKAKSFQDLSLMLGLPNRNFYVVVRDHDYATDELLFFDNKRSYLRSILDTGFMGKTGAIAVTKDGNTLFLSSTGGMKKYSIGTTPPGTAVALPVTRREYTDLVFDMPRGRIYGTDVSNNVDVINMNTSAVVRSYLLPSGAKPTGIDLSPDGTELAIALNGLESILFMNPVTGAEIARVTPELVHDWYYYNRPNDVVYGRPGRLYTDAANLHVFDTATHTWIGRSVSGIYTEAELAVTAAKDTLYNSAPGSPQDILRWDISIDPPAWVADTPRFQVAAGEIAASPNGAKIFTAGGQVWSGDLQTKLGDLAGGPGELVEYIPGRNTIALTEQNWMRGTISFINAFDYRLLTMYATGTANPILEMESAPDGSRLAVSLSGGKFVVLDMTGSFPPGEKVTGVPRETYTASHGTDLPGTLLCNNQVSLCTGGTNADADGAHKYAGGITQLYMDRHDRNSIDGNGMTILSTVNYGSRYNNAYWDGDRRQMVYGDRYGFARADDVVAHELTHGVTQYESNLFYVYQSGAINESFSDLWGEGFDQLNGQGVDTSTVKWLVGEDVTGMGAIRDMRNPQLFGDPNKMTSAHYYRGTDDNGGVHTNSGVNNKAVSLMVDGGSFNGRTIARLGWNKVLPIYYEAQTHLLTSGSDYLDLHNALYQACLNKVGTAAITGGDCNQVRSATLAVEMDRQPVPNFNPDAGPLCPEGTTFYPVLFHEDFETGTDGWSRQSTWNLRWDYATSGTSMLHGDDTFFTSGSQSATLARNIYLPADSRAFLYFRHVFGYESGIYKGKTFYFDGGVLEYSVNNGEWMDAGPLFRSGRNYTGTVTYYHGSGNPLQGKPAFVGDSHGYVSSQYDLGSLAGKNVRFRWRSGTDFAGHYFGWGLDDVSIYTCPRIPSRPLLQAPAHGARLTDYTPAFNWSDSTPALHHYRLQIATDSGFKALVLEKNNILTSAFAPENDLAIGKTYYWRVSAYNAAGGTRGWSGARMFKTVPRRPWLSAPKEGEVLSQNRPTFDWNDVPGVVSYTIQVAAADTFTAPLVISANTTGSEFTPVADLPANVALYWRVRANSPAGNSMWSLVRSFQSADPPEIPVLLAPPDGSASSDASPDFDWSDSTLPAGTTLDHYQVQVSTDNTYAAPEIDQNLPGSAFTPSTDLGVGQVYFWRVRAFNTLEQSSAWSTAFSFGILPLAPVLLVPGPDATGVPLQPAFDWEDAPGAVNYTLQVSLASDFAIQPLIVDITTPDAASGYALTSDLPAATLLYWRVRANSLAGPGEWSVPGTFMTQ